MWIFWMPLEIVWLGTTGTSISWIAWDLLLTSLRILKSRWLRSCGSGGWYHADRLTENLGCGWTFWGLGIWTGDGSVLPPPFINRVKPSVWKSIMFSSPRGLASKLFLLCFDAMSSFFFIRWRKKRERMETMGMDGAICQLLWWACHNISVVVTGLPVKRDRGLLLQLDVFVWSSACLVQFRPWG